MKKLILSLFILFNLSSFGQEVKNISFKQEGDKIIITYDLYEKDYFDVQCFYTIDDGVNYIELVSATGDIGAEIRKGNNKEIVWDVFKDTDFIKGKIQFKIIAIGINVRKYYYISYGIPIIDNSGFNMNIGRFGYKRLGFGLNFAYYRNPDDDKVIIDCWYDKNFGISPVISYKIINKQKFQFLVTGKIGVSNWKSTRDIFRNPTIGVIINASHFQLYLDYGVINVNYYSDYYINEVYYLESDYYKRKVINLGIGYTF